MYKDGWFRYPNKTKEQDIKYRTSSVIKSLIASTSFILLSNIKEYNPDSFINIACPCIFLYKDL